MTKKEILQIIANGSKPMVRTHLADGRYYASKTNDNYVCLQKTGTNYAPVEMSEAIKGQPIIVLTDVQDAKNGANRTIAVNDEFINWSLGTGFSFIAKNGRTELNLEVLDKNKIKKLLAETVN